MVAHEEGVLMHRHINKVLKGYAAEEKTDQIAQGRLKDYESRLKTYKRLGQILVERGIITESQARLFNYCQKCLLLDVISHFNSPREMQSLLSSVVEAVEEGIITKSQAQLFDYCQKCLLLDMISHINSTIDIQSLLIAIMEASEVIMEAEASSLIMLDKETQELIIVVPTGPASSEISGIRIPKGQGFCGWVVSHEVPLVVDDAQNDPRFFGDVADDFHTTNLICVPLHNSEGETIGALEAINKQDGGSFIEEDIPLFEALADQAAIALEKARLYKESVEKQLLEQQLDLARQIQEGFWPKQLPSYEGIELAGMNVPATHVGGDYYDFIPMDSNRCALVIGDISGKGEAAALLMATLRAALRAQVENKHPVEETIFLVNNMLVKDTPPEKYVTLFYGVFDVARHEFTYVNAGHNPPMLYDQHTGEMNLLSTGGTIIGFLEDIPFEAACENLRPGQALLLYTDGITEAQNPAGEMFGEERLQALVRQYADDDAKSLMGQIHQTVIDFTQGAPQYDDITLVVMKVSLFK